MAALPKKRQISRRWYTENRHLDLFVVKIVQIFLKQFISIILINKIYLQTIIIHHTSLAHNYAFIECTIYNTSHSKLRKITTQCHSHRNKVNRMLQLLHRYLVAVLIGKLRTKYAVYSFSRLNYTVNRNRTMTK